MRCFIEFLILKEKIYFNAGYSIRIITQYLSFAFSNVFKDSCHSEKYKHNIVYIILHNSFMCLTHIIKFMWTTLYKYYCSLLKHS